LTLLRQTVALEGHESDCISELLIGEQPIYENILVATTRVPTFGIGLQEPVNGYRRLGSLRSLLDGQMVMPPPPPDPVIHDRELLAMKDNSETRNFLQSWGPIGVLCDTHFIVIFYKPPMALANMTHLFTLDSHSSSASSNALPVLCCKTLLLTSLMKIYELGLAQSGALMSHPIPGVSFLRQNLLHLQQL